MLEDESWLIPKLGVMIAFFSWGYEISRLSLSHYLLVRSVELLSHYLLMTPLVRAGFLIHTSSGLGLLFWVVDCLLEGRSVCA